MELATTRLILREFQATDFNALRELEAHPETYRYEGANPTEASIRTHLEKIMASANDNPRIEFRLAITIPPHDVVRGRISLFLLNSSIREWEIGWAVHPQEWGNGYAPEAARRLLDFAFGELGVHRITAFCHVLNKASVRVMEKLSMQRDGRLRETRWWNDGWSDEFVYAILERDWKKERS